MFGFLFCFIFVSICLFALLELWSEWLKDEMPLACIPEHKEKVMTLFERAVTDYQCKYKCYWCWLVCFTLSSIKASIKKSRKSFGSRSGSYWTCHFFAIKYCCSVNSSCQDMDSLLSIYDGYHGRTTQYWRCEVNIWKSYHCRWSSCYRGTVY